MNERITITELARRVGVSPQALSAAARKGRVTRGPDGLVDAAGGAAQWLANRVRRPRVPKDKTPSAAPETSDRPGRAATGAPDFWAHRTEREAAEASIARMREREMSGELVRRADVERELAAKLIGLREALEGLGDRLASLVAAESDISACRRLLRDEHRNALAAFAQPAGAAAPAPAPAPAPDAGAAAGWST